MDALFEQFIQKWTHPNYTPSKVQASDFAEVEAQFGSLPQIYKDIISTYGAPHTTAALLDTIVERQLDLSDVSEFHVPDEIISATKGWRALGLPPDLVAFASDCAGNSFCFKPADLPNSTVWFFDHDLIEVYEVAPSFLEWIRQYSDL